MKTAVLINLLNPKLSLFFFAFLPQFTSTHSPNYLKDMLFYSAVFMLMTFVVFALYAIFAGLMRKMIVSRPKILDGIRQMFAATFLALGVKLALQDS